MTRLPTVAGESGERWQKGSAPRSQSLLCDTAIPGLGVDEEGARGVHRGWEGLALLDTAGYLRAPGPYFVMINNRLADGGGPYMWHNSGKHLIFLPF